MEIAGTTRRSRASAEFQIGDAERYVEALPLTVAALSRGELFEHQARAVLDVTRNCTVAVARRVEEQVLPGALELSPADMKRKLTKAVLQVESELDSAAVTERLIQARKGRRVWAQPEVDGMATVGVLGAAEAVQQCLIDLDRLVQMEKAADRAAGVWRSADQIRSDVMLTLPGQVLKLLEGSGVHVPTRPAKDSIINVHVPVTTVLERGNEPGLLGGYGPISAEHVRLMRPDARFRRVYVDARTGQPTGLDTELTPVAADAEEAMERIRAMLTPAVITHASEPQHDPSRELRRFVEVRDRLALAPDRDDPIEPTAEEAAATAC